MSHTEGVDEQGGRDAGAVVTLEVDGELDIETGEALQQAVQRVLDEGAHQVRIDLTPTTFVDSAGLAALLRAAREVRERHGEIHVDSPHGSEARLFIELSGTQSVLGLSDDPPAEGAGD
jgi:anti-anti-sigma factor